MNKIFDVAIVGAGVSGLSCAHTLSSQNNHILLLEARDRLGGRAFTMRSSEASVPIELGAEFIHGQPPSLCSYLDRSKIPYYEVKDAHVYTTPRQQNAVDFWKRLEAFEKKMNVHVRDRSIHQFIMANKKSDSRIKTLFKGFIEGFHAADIDRISENYLATARDEAADSEGLDKSFRIVDGYQRFVDDTLDSIDKENTEILTSTEVQTVRWKKNEVVIETTQGSFKAHKVVIAVPTAVLKAQKGDRGWIDIEPRPQALDEMLSGFDTGHVCKITFVFRSCFWEDQLKEEFSFIHAGAEKLFPTWWSMLPMRSPVLVAWQGGPKALSLLNQSIEDTIETALKTLSTMVKLSVSKIRREVISTHMHNWSHDPFSRGAYSYIVVDGVSKARKLAQPIEDTLYFTGESLAPFPDIATVHGAMQAGVTTAKKILKNLSL